MDFGKKKGEYALPRVLYALGFKMEFLKLYFLCLKISVFFIILLEEINVT